MKTIYLSYSRLLSQIQELVNYIVRHRSEEERSAFIRPFQDALKTEGKKPIEEDEERRKRIFSMALVEVKGLGDGSDRGALPVCFERLPTNKFE